MILAPAAMAAESDPKKAAARCFEEIGLDPDMYRIGHTKASCKPPNQLNFFLGFTPSFSSIVKYCIRTVLCPNKISVKLCPPFPQ